MRIKINKVRKADQVMEELTKRYGSFHALTQKVSLSKCSSGSEMEDLMMWKYLKQGATMEEEIVFQNPDIHEVLSPRRMDLIDFLRKNEVSSIRKLSEALHRNYKNTYDDLIALEAFDIIELIPSGKSRTPICSVRSIETIFEN